MPAHKKFGAFAGVFTPSLLTILGVIMYMRLGWVVGNAGLVGTIVIIIIAHVISITTGLSVSSIATDKKVGAGGIYYVLSRSLGLPIGGAIGVTLFTGTAMSIALYLIGFAESFNPYFGFDSGINGLRIGGSLALLTLTVLALISTSLALKAQFFILAAIIISLVSLFLGVSPQVPESLPYLPPSDGVSMEVIFAVFFPAVTGFTAGIAMSGDLKDPKKAIPVGTLWSIAVGFVVYIGLALFIFYSIDGELLKTDNNILLKLAFFAPAVVAGIWGATLSSALGGVLGGPRILQAMSVDKITPRLFARGAGKGNDPRNALFLTVIIAEAGILIGELDTIARVCSMFYLAAYCFINLSFFLENWASSDFNPTFKVKKWVGLVGFIATFVVMFRLDMLAMVVAFIVIGGIYFWLAKRQLALGSGDVWQSVWSSVVKTGLRRMDDNQDHKRNWKPNVLLFSGGTEQRPHLLEFSKELVGNRGIVTNFDLKENQDAKLLFPKRQQSVNDDILKRYGVFGRQLEVKNVFKGIESIATTFGFSGIEPNTILMGWAKNTADPIWFAQMTQKLIDLDYNVLYLDYDKRFGFRKYSQIDLWWRSFGNNAELMLNISKFLVSSDLWRNAQIRVLLVDESNSNKKIIEKKINNILDEFRVVASVKIIGNEVEKRPLYELMKIYSSDTDLVLVGIPEMKMDEVQSFVSTTNNLVSTIGTTLLVKASTQFDDIEFLTPNHDIHVSENGHQLVEQSLPPLVSPESLELEEGIAPLNLSVEKAFLTLIESALEPIQKKYTDFYQNLIMELKRVEKAGLTGDVHTSLSTLMQNLQSNLSQLRTEELPILKEIFLEENIICTEKIEDLINAIPKKINLELGATSTKVKLKQMAGYLQVNYLTSPIYDTYATFGNMCYENLTKSINEIISKTYHFIELEGFKHNPSRLTEELQNVITEMIEMVSIQSHYFQHLDKELEFELLSTSRRFSNELSIACQHPNIADERKKIIQSINKKTNRIQLEEIAFFPTSWTENQKLIHSSLETNLKLAQSNIIINKGIAEVLANLNQEVNKRIEKQFAQHNSTMQLLNKEFEEGLELKSYEKFVIDEDSFIGTETLMQHLTNQTSNIFSIVDEEVLLMSKTMLEDFESQQFEGIGPTMLNLPKIVDFILETKLYGPIRTHMEHYLSDISNIYYNQINRVNLLNYSLSETKDKKEVKDLLAVITRKFETEEELYHTTKMRFEEQIREILYDLQMVLDNRYLVENADNWIRYINVSKRKEGLAKLNETVRAKFNNTYNSMNRTLAEKKHESVISVFESKYNLKSNVEKGLMFVNSLYPKPEVLSKLPFYYKQLFLGKQLPVQNRYIGREKELEQYKNSIPEKRKGAILIVGKSASGKSHFSEYLASLQKSKHIFRIDTIGKTGSVLELKRAIAAGTNKTGGIEQCLAKLPKHSTIIFGDIEVWWDRSADVDALSVLIEVIEKFSNNHCFILNGNLHALEALSKQRPIDSVLATTIVLSPMSKEEVNDIIIERHKVGGLDMEYKDEENEINSKKFSRLITKLYNESQGNIGLSLQFWLRNIDNYSNNKIDIHDSNPNELLKVSDSRWKWLIYQFIINNHLSKNKISALFGEDAEESVHIIGELAKSKIVDKIGPNTYSLNSTVKPNVESWLEYQDILN